MPDGMKLPYSMTDACTILLMTVHDDQILRVRIGADPLPLVLGQPSVRPSACRRVRSPPVRLARQGHLLLSTFGSTLGFPSQ